VAETADVVIIGGGIIGNAIAWNLARKGAGKIILLEKEKHIGQGMTAYSAGGVREQFSSEINIRLSKFSLDVFGRFKEEMDQDIDYKQAGYLFLAATEETEAALRRNVELQNRVGVESRLITPEEAREKVRDLNIEDLRLAAFNARDGYVDPSSICQGYNLKARELGVEIRTRTAATGFRIAGERVQAVQTPAGEIEAATYVNATGPYLHEVGKLADLDIPAQPYRRMLFITEKFSLSPNLIPLTIDMATGFYFRQEGDGLMLGRADPEEPSSFDTTLDWDYLEQILEYALHRIPTVENAQIGKGWAGLYDITPDHHPLLGPYPELPNLILAGGFSGHGIMHGPAVGVVIAEMVLDGQPKSIDISILSPTRIREDKLLVEKNVI
jgi:sarcosine oxidase subunit beta